MSLRLYLSPCLASWRGCVFRRPCARSAATAPVKKIDKEALMQLRRETGYSFLNCKRAVLKFGSDTESALAWLHELAEQEDWQRATKMRSRPAREGLIGVASGGNVGACVELNCQTDFVSRNDTFRSLLDELAFEALQQARHIDSDCVEVVADPSNSDTSLYLARMSHSKSKIRDAVIAATASLRENIHVSRYTLMKAPAGCVVRAYAHPRDIPVGLNDTLMGRFGTLVAVGRDQTQKDSQSEVLPLDNIAGALCQHVIGMAPKSIEAANDVNVDNVKEETVVAVDHEAELDPEERSTVLLNADDMHSQSFILRPDITVAEYLRMHKATCLQFVRYERGEQLR